MAFVVRTEHGELQFATADEVWHGVRAGTVSIEDQVREAQGSAWQPVATLPGAPQHAHVPAHLHWYLLALVLTALLVLFGPSWPTALVVLAVLSCHAVWRAMRRRR